MKGLTVYVDETGDPGWTDKATPIYALSGVAVAEEDEVEARSSLAQLRLSLNKPPGTILHWKKNTKHEARLVIANEVSKQEYMALIQVCMFKPHLENMNQDPTGIHQYSLRLMVERASWLAKRSNRAVTVRVSQVQNIGQSTIDRYMNLIRRLDNRIEWQHLNGVRVHRPEQYELLQMADLTAGPIHRAFVPDQQFGTLEPSYLRKIRPLMWVASDPAPCPNYGFKMMPGPNKKRVAEVLRAFPNLATVL